MRVLDRVNVYMYITVPIIIYDYIMHKYNNSKDTVYIIPESPKTKLYMEYP